MFPQNLTSMLSLAAMQDHAKSDSQDGNESPPLSGPTILVEPKHGEWEIFFFFNRFLRAVRARKETTETSNLPLPPSPRFLFYIREEFIKS